MLAVLQRVKEASVEVGGKEVARIGPGLLALVCAQPGDSLAQCDRLLAKMLSLRIFSDAAGKMNHSVQDMDGSGRAGGLLLVSQFTLAADTGRGNRPGFSAAAPPDLGRRLFEALVEKARTCHGEVQSGQFGADMQVSLINDGPVTIPLQVRSDART